MTRVIIHLAFILSAASITAGTISGRIKVGAYPGEQVEVELRREGKLIADTMTDDRGDYAFDKVPHGVIAMRIKPINGPERNYLVELGEDPINVSTTLPGKVDLEIAKTIRAQKPNPLEPVDALYEAWRKMDLELYKKQWAPGATRTQNGSKESLESLFKKRAAQFSSWKSAKTDLVITKFDQRGDTALVSVFYTLVITPREGQAFANSGSDTYRTKLTAGKWLITENIDNDLPK